MEKTTSFRQNFTHQKIAQALFDIPKYDTFELNLELFRESEICKNYKTDNSIWNDVCLKILQKEYLHYKTHKKYVPVCYYSLIKDDKYKSVKEAFDKIVKENGLNIEESVDVINEKMQMLKVQDDDEANKS